MDQPTELFHSAAAALLHLRKGRDWLTPSLSWLSDQFSCDMKLYVRATSTLAYLL